jgi:predicted ATPase
MTEIKRVHYKLNGTESPVIHLDCRTIEEAQEANRIATSNCADVEQWKDKAFADLREWMDASKDYRKTIETWAAVYIRCGRCLTEWREWCEANQVGDITAWIDAASKVVTEKRWI